MDPAVENYTSAVEDYTLTDDYEVHFTAYAPLHTFKGWTCKEVEAQIGIDFDALTIDFAKARAKTACFDTGDAERNKAMFDYMQIDKAPEASIELTTIKSFTRTDDTRYKVEVLAVLEFMGQARQLPLNFVITRSADKMEFSIALDFKWSFKAFGLKAPSLLFLKVRDIVDISGKGRFIKADTQSACVP